MQRFNRWLMDLSTVPQLLVIVALFIPGVFVICFFVPLIIVAGVYGIVLAGKLIGLLACLFGG